MSSNDDRPLDDPPGSGTRGSVDPAPGDDAKVDELMRALGARKRSNRSDAAAFEQALENRSITELAKWTDGDELRAQELRAVLRPLDRHENERAVGAALSSFRKPLLGRIAAAASVLVAGLIAVVAVIPRNRSGDPAMQYTLLISGGASEMKSPGTSELPQRIVLKSSTLLELRLRAHETTPDVELDTHVFQEGRLKEWRPPVRAVSNGVFEIQGTAERLLPGLRGAVTLVLVLHRPGLEVGVEEIATEIIQGRAHPADGIVGRSEALAHAPRIERDGVLVFAQEVIVEIEGE